MTRAEILAQTTWTKSQKMRALHALGLTINEIAEAVGTNYGFAYNAVHGTGRTRRAATAPAASRPAPVMVTAEARRFMRRFGIELEATGVQRPTLVAELRAQGLEAETEGYNHTTRPHWKAVTDGSLHGTDTFELVSPVLEGRDGLDEVASACRALRHTNAQVNATCGFHAHFDANGLTQDHLRRICINYIRLETLIDSLMAPSRRANANRFCRSINQNGVVEKLRNATNFRELERALNAGDRYFKLNLTSFYRHGTIEFRQHQGTVDAEKVTFWLRFLHCLIDYSEQHEIPAEIRPSITHLAAFCPREVVTFFTRRQQALAA